jgi:hypothetical protein
VGRGDGIANQAIVPLTPLACQAMARDTKINVMQETATQLEKRTTLLRKLLSL